MYFFTHKSTILETLFLHTFPSLPTYCMFFETASPAYSFYTDDDLALLPAQTRNINNLQLPSELSYRTARHKKSVCVFLCSSFLSYLTWQVTMTVHVYHFIGKKAECVTRNTVSPFWWCLKILMVSLFCACWILSLSSRVNMYVALWRIYAHKTNSVTTVGVTVRGTQRECRKKNVWLCDNG